MARKRWALLAGLILLVAACALALTSGAGAVTRCGFASGPLCSADLSVSLTAPAGTVYVGQEVTLPGTLSNRGPDLARGVTAALSGPVSIPAVAWRGTRRINCSSACKLAAASPAVGATQPFSPRVRIEAAGQIGITVSISTVPPRTNDPNPADNSATVTLTAAIGRCTSVLEYPPGLGVTLVGTVGGDVLRGTGGSDDLEGKAGDDCINGQGGTDFVSGGSGNDVLRGGAADDVIYGGPGRDRMLGGPGDDEIHAIDGKRDLISCGPGEDTLRADAVDRFSGCEDVELHGHRRHRRS